MGRENYIIKGFIISALHLIMMITLRRLGWATSVVRMREIPGIF
jgi:hypothetical protein